MSQSTCLQSTKKKKKNKNKNKKTKIIIKALKKCIILDGEMMSQKHEESTYDALIDGQKLYC